MELSWIESNWCNRRSKTKIRKALTSFYSRIESMFGQSHRSQVKCQHNKFWTKKINFSEAMGSRRMNKILPLSRRKSRITIKILMRVFFQAALNRINSTRIVCNVNLSRNERCQNCCDCCSNIPSVTFEFNILKLRTRIFCSKQLVGGGVCLLCER